MTSAPSLLFSVSYRFVDKTIFEADRDASTANKFSNQVILRGLDEHVCPTTALPCTNQMRSRFDLPSGEHPAQPVAQMRQTSLILISSLPNNLLVLASFIVMQADIGLSGPQPRPVVRLMIPCTDVLGVVGVYRSKAELE
jgi:hypothetical protein